MKGRTQQLTEGARQRVGRALAKERGAFLKRRVHT